MESNNLSGVYITIVCDMNSNVMYSDRNHIMQK